MTEVKLVSAVGRFDGDGDIEVWLRKFGVVAHLKKLSDEDRAAIAAYLKKVAAGDGESILVLGDMRELGSNAEELHRQAGRHAKEAGVSQLVATGELTRHAVEGFGEGAHWLPNVEAIVEFLRPRLRKGQRLLVKGSRSMHMGRVVRALQRDSVTDAGTG